MSVQRQAQRRGPTDLEQWHELAESPSTLHSPSELCYRKLRATSDCSRQLWGFDALVAT